MPHCPKHWTYQIIHLSDLDLTGDGPYEQDLCGAVPAAGPGGRDRPVVSSRPRRRGKRFIPLLMEIGAIVLMLGVLGNHDAAAREHGGVGPRLGPGGRAARVNDAAAAVERGHRRRFLGVDHPTPAGPTWKRRWRLFLLLSGTEPEPVVGAGPPADVFWSGNGLARI